MNFYYLYQGAQIWEKSVKKIAQNRVVHSVLRYFYLSFHRCKNLCTEIKIVFLHIKQIWQIVKICEGKIFQEIELTNTKIRIHQSINIIHLVPG